MIEGKYLTKDCIIHHINLDKLDNMIENLWIFEDQKGHMKSRKTLYQCFSDLIKLGKIVFTKEDGYQIIKNLNMANLSNSRISELLQPRGLNFFGNIESVNEDIKEISWDKKYSNWTVKKRQNQF